MTRIRCHAEPVEARKDFDGLRQNGYFRFKAVPTSIRSRWCPVFQHEARRGRAVDPCGRPKPGGGDSDSVTRNPGALISLARLKTVPTIVHPACHSGGRVRRSLVAPAGQLKLRRRPAAAAFSMAEPAARPGQGGHSAGVLQQARACRSLEFTAVRSHPVEGYRLADLARIRNRSR